MNTSEYLTSIGSHINTEDLPPEFTFNAFHLENFNAWLQDLHQHDLRIFNMALYAENALFLSGLKAQKETPNLAVYVLNDVKNDERLCIVNDKKTGQMFYFCEHEKAVPELVLSTLLNQSLS